MALPTSTTIVHSIDDIADEDLIDPALVIHPPEEMRTIIEKTVSFVVKNGIEFESKVRDSQRSNRKFDFLNPGHAFHNYYKQKYQIAKYPKAAALAEKYKSKKAALHSSQQSLLGLDDKNKNKKTKKNAGVITHKLTLKQRIMQQLALNKKPKSQYIIEPTKYSKFIVPLPTKRITAYEIAVIKLVAQFTACHGKSFIRDLQRGEPENETFGFLSPMHPRFQYFQRLIDAYSNIIDEFEDYQHNKRNKKRNNVLNVDRDSIWYAAIGCAEWTNREKEKEAKYLLNEENERRANALIDWQSFTVLDSIDFEDDDLSHLVPPGKNIEEIEAILESTLDVEADINDIGSLLAHGMEQDMDISASDSDMEQDDDNDINNEIQTQPQPQITIEMEQEKTELHRKQIAKAKVFVKLKSAPMPAPKGVIISNDLDIIPTRKMETDADIELRLKLEKILNDSRNEQLENQQCPICGEYINILHLSQHIRIELLDPKWKEQKESLKLKLSQTTLASNQQISENLIKFNQAQNIDANDNNNPTLDGVQPWNGHQDSLAQQKQLKAAQEELKKQEKLLKEQAKEKERASNEANNKPPPPQPHYPPMPIPMQPRHTGHSHSQQSYLNPMMNAHFARPPHPPPHPHAHIMLPPHHPYHHHRPHVPPFVHMGQPPFPPPPAMRHPQQPQHPQPSQPQQAMMQQPAAKKMKLNNNKVVGVGGGNKMEGLIEENEFIQQNGGVGNSVKIRIKVPKNEKKKQFNFNGQTLTFTMQLKQNVNELKQRIHSVLSIPTNKQKLRIQTNGIWVKDANSLAFYNINSSSMLELATRTRGGKKNK